MTAPLRMSGSDLEPRHEGSRRPSTTTGSGRRENRTLLGGQYLVSAQPTAITAMLGSCVCVCLWQPRREVGGVAHFLMPSAPLGDAADAAGVQHALSSRYGRAALPCLLAALTDLTCPVDQLQAKIFGGAGARTLADGTSLPRSLASENVSMARRFLESAGIPIVAEDVGGDRARKLIFHTDDGSAWVKRY